MHYMLQVGETRNPGELLSTLASRVPEHEDTLMTIAEKLRLEGEKRGLEKGRLEGWQEGRQEGEREAALKIARAMLASGLDRDLVMKMTGLTIDDLAQLRH
jgi:predicted transposase/invertase (TIGR01784 family)